MKEFNTIREIDINKNTGKLLLSALSILSSNNFRFDSRYGSGVSFEILVEELIRLSEFIYNYKFIEYNKYKNDISNIIDYNIDEDIMLLTCIDILTTDVCKNGNYGSHMNVDFILRNIKKITLINNRERLIDLVIK